MGGRQLLTIAFCSLVCVGYANTRAHAGWFGPSNYSECMIEKMKGQPWNMSELVEATCTLQFACNDKFASAFRKCMGNAGSMVSAGTAASCQEEARQYCN